MPVPRELFVISDLHIGGERPSAAASLATKAGSSSAEARGFRINTHVGELAGFLRELVARRRRAGWPIELVINGDIVDFLAERSPRDGHFKAFVSDPAEALEIFTSIVGRNTEFFDALAELPAAGVALTLLLGNHDLELSFPLVRDRLLEPLLVGAKAPVRFIHDGEACVIGDVLIDHGHRDDGWNVVDHDALRRFRADSTRGLDDDRADFTPPPGSELVERLLNPIKGSYPFVDLLKPETDAALPLLMTLEPGLASLANGLVLAQLGAEAARNQPMAPGRPAFSGQIAAGRSLPALEDSLRRQIGEAATELIALARQADEVQNRQRGEIAAGRVVDRALSFLGLDKGSAYEARLRLLVPALRALRGDHSFDRKQEGHAKTLAAAIALAGGRGRFSTVVFGHTHLAKEQLLPGGRAKYLNTGTWADLMQVPRVIVDGSPAQALDASRAFADDLRAGRLDPYVTWHPTFAQIRFDDGGHAVEARLRDHVPGVLETP